MSDPYIVLEFPDGQRVAQRVVIGTTLEDLEDLWRDAWLDYCVGHDQRIRVGLGHGTLYRSQFESAPSEAVKRLSTAWLGYRDAKWPADESDGGDIPWPSPTEMDEINRRNVEGARQMEMFDEVQS